MLFPKVRAILFFSSIRFSPPLVSREGYIISGGDDWIVYAWEGSRMIMDGHNFVGLRCDRVV